MSPVLPGASMKHPLRTCKSAPISANVASAPVIGYNKSVSPVGIISSATMPRTIAGSSMTKPPASPLATNRMRLAETPLRAMRKRSLGAALAGVRGV